MVTADGTLYKEFKIQGVNDESLQIIHAEGSASIAFTNLPPDLRERWLPAEKPGIPEPRETTPIETLEPATPVNNLVGAEQLKAGDHTISLSMPYAEYERAERPRIGAFSD